MEERVSTKEFNASLNVLLQQLPDGHSIENRGREITDPDALDKIAEIMPALGRAGKKASKAIRAYQKVSKPVYKFILKKADKAPKAVKKPLQKGVKLVECIVKDETVLAVLDVGVGAANIATAIIEGYYRQQVSGGLTEINDKLSKVVAFQEIEYKSQVSALVEAVYTISKYQGASVRSDEVRSRELDTLQQLRLQCQQLLNQAESHLQNCIAGLFTDYGKYQKQTKEIETWKQYQAVLLQLFYQINLLDFALHKGAKGKMQCFGSFAIHVERSEKLQSALTEWHEQECKLLKIDLEQSRRKRDGILAYLEKPISWLNDEWNYQPIDEQTNKRIQSQIATSTAFTCEEESLFDKDVEIVVKNGKYYYLPEEK